MNEASANPPFFPLVDLLTQPPPPRFHHYTGAAGLLGILKKEKHELWASAMGFSNDATEGLYATQIGQEIIENHPLAKEDAEPFRQIYWLIQALFAPYPDWENGYVISFCEEDNVLSQWRAYGAGAGFSIGFSASSYADMECPSGSEIRLVKVEYSLSKQRENLRRTLDGVHDLLRRSASSTSLKDVLSSLGSMLYVYISQWACSVKHEAFKEEKEWRITVFPNYDWSSPAAAFGMLGKRLPLIGHPEFREHRGRLLPYVSVKPKTGKFEIESITVGPSKTQALDRKAIELLVEKLSLSNVKILCSDIPLQS